MARDMGAADGEAWLKKILYGLRSNPTPGVLSFLAKPEDRFSAISPRKRDIGFIGKARHGLGLLRDHVDVCEIQTAIQTVSGVCKRTTIQASWTPIGPWIRS